MEGMCGGLGRRAWVTSHCLPACLVPAAGDRGHPRCPGGAGPHGGGAGLEQADVSGAGPSHAQLPEKAGWGAPAAAAECGPAAAAAVTASPWRGPGALGALSWRGLRRRGVLGNGDGFLKAQHTQLNTGPFLSFPFCTHLFTSAYSQSVFGLVGSVGFFSCLMMICLPAYIFAVRTWPGAIQCPGPG